MAGRDLQLQHRGHSRDLEDRELRTAIMRRFTRFEMLSRDEIKAWDGDYQVHPPEAVAAMFK